MTISTLAFGKASASGRSRLCRTATRFQSTAPQPSAHGNGNVPNGYPQPPGNGGNGNGSVQRHVDPSIHRELFMNVLNVNATKRDAKQYLARFASPKSPSKLVAQNDQDRQDLGVNLGDLYRPARAIAESPQFVRAHEEKTPLTVQESVHIALVCLRAPETLDEATLDGVALTLSQLVKLDMRIVLLLDCTLPHDTIGTNSRETLKSEKKLFTDQGNRICQALSRHGSEGGRVVHGALEVSEASESHAETGARGNISVGMPKLLMEPLKRSVIPILPNLAHTPSGQLVQVEVPSVMYALTRKLSGLPTSDTSSLVSTSVDRISGLPTSDTSSNASVPTSLDRIILLDSYGGIPSKARGDGAHVYINLEQEFDEISEELATYERALPEDQHAPIASKLYAQHRTNLRTLRDCLALLPSASSALIVHPQEVANSSQDPSSSTFGTGTRRQKNALIHNLLTNKPLVSSSLPVARLPGIKHPASFPHQHIPTSTLVKRGMPVTIIPALPRGDIRGLQPPPPNGTTSLDLRTDPRVDFPRLLHLIEDSFGRKLDVEHYLSRISGRVAGIIVAGAYEGGAILTWETPPPRTEHPTPSINPNNVVEPPVPVPYLDKFAVLQSAQGSAGVADIVFQALVRSCFPAGVCWRSRDANPVNKWYFERCAGSWRIPGSGWTMFWTGEGVVTSSDGGDGAGRFADYVTVCRAVEGSLREKTKK